MTSPSSIAAAPPLVDSFGRTHTSLRLSVTDRCNIRCVYCMPGEQVLFLPRREVLTFEELERFVRVSARLGVRQVRLTGGEPLVRSELSELVRRLVGIAGIDEVTLTTNGVLLDRHAAELKAAGLDRLNISLDTVRPEAFRELTRRDLLPEVLRGIEAAQQAGFSSIRINAIAMRGVTEQEIVPLGRFARERALELRFIEYMPLDADASWRRDQVLSGDEILAALEAEFGPLSPAPRSDPSQPARDYAFADGGVVGFINPVTQPFCSDCNRLRLTAEGQIRNCLFSPEEWDARRLLRDGASDGDLARLIREAVAAKRAGHGIDAPGFHRPDRAMYQIGG
ncbi:Cyclic pyranopterin monophosphate synthase [Posidoniimonas polymericola]|uniref:GTP 3',8-cyclase n=1 Tax=Posidoniimonas polymericola TaxID=2528002 RepID=A0A5C5XWE6_9BACT|nr:GTP 3',8-cyclase MoaA [Posidoniimonas polymericola]TWT67656.1 Cyclic pyranopterin monophosphate synthase [Posidoniimonas polymericola]